MKMSKKTWMIIAVVGVIVLIYWLMTKNKKGNKESSFTNKTGGTTGGSQGGKLKRALSLFGYCVANQVECEQVGTGADYEAKAGGCCCCVNDGTRLVYAGPRGGTQA